ncbi:uncharacterized protein LOC129767042 [Toxorhynchites rutilus septentrionalis]|uniref:uncharacterized protein LOC129767042 n=1 Tax=Toxorhynchites rutilus septentrionalis TaxID=329112 RepID=UPI00247925D9|nr:uncharacterized protein LOC129767042 [Toxorhynchites rutilus septentrionalis]
MFNRNTIAAVLPLLIASFLRLPSCCQSFVSVPSYFLIGDDVRGSFIASAANTFDAPQAPERPGKMLMANGEFVPRQQYRKASDGDQYGDYYGSDDYDYNRRKAGKNHRKSAGKSGPVHTYIKTDKNANFKWGVRHFAGRRYAGRR